MTKNIKHYDIAIIGGGINGMAIARDASGRGLNTFLCDKDDFGSATSAWSSKMIHGGLRYLEFYEFSLVRKALKERDILIKLAPHMVREQRFILPHQTHLRPKLLIRAGLFLYDNLYQSAFLKKSCQLKIKSAFLKEHLKEGFEYSDTVVDDHRLVIELAHEAAQQSAILQNNTRCKKVILKDGYWEITLQKENNKEEVIQATNLINATGPWADTFSKEKTDQRTAKTLKLVKGSHLVVPQLYPEKTSYTFQDAKGRIVFTFPYLNDYTLIGTTEETHKGDPNTATMSKDEQTYLLKIIKDNFKKTVKASDIVWHYSGVRPLIDNEGKDNRTASRDYEIEKCTHDKNTLIHIWGGKLTTHRILAETVLDELGFKNHWTSKKPFASKINLQTFINDLKQQYPFLEENLLTRYAQAYGSRTKNLLTSVQNIEDLGQNFGKNLYEKEVLYLIKNEWATTAESILWFRTKCGVSMSEKQIEIFKKAFQTFIK